MFTTQQLAVLTFISEEVYRQRDDARFVPFMVDAWMDACILAGRADDPYTLITPEVLTRWAQKISPRENRLGCRSDKNPVNVRVGQSYPPQYFDVPRLLYQFCEAVREGKFLPAEAYKAFEELHPYRDGNGRTGKVLFSFLRNELLAPTFPPNFWGSSNP